MKEEPTAGAAPEERESLLRMVAGYRVTQALYVVTKLGIPDKLAIRPKEAGELAREASVDPDRLFRVLRVLASIGVFRIEPGGRFALAGPGELLRTDVRGSLAAFTLLQGEEGYRSFGELLHTVKTGETAFDHVFGMGHFDYLAQQPAASVTFNRAMADSRHSVRDPLHGYDLGGRRLIVDVGGGTGALLVTVLRHNPHLRGMLFDLPSVVAEATQFLASSGVADRCEIRSGSAFERVPEGGDVYVLSRILHDWPDEKALVLLRNCRRAMPSDGVLLLKESVLPEGIVPPGLAERDLMMMVMNGGRERTESEWRTLLRNGGFTLGRFPVSESNPDLLEATPA